VDSVDGWRAVVRGLVGVATAKVAGMECVYDAKCLGRILGVGRN
jgi:hypothetical protein